MIGVGLVFLSGCSAPPLVTATPAPTLAVTPSPSPSPTPFPAEALSQTLEQLFQDAFSPALPEQHPANLFDPTSPWNFFDAEEADRLWLLTYAEDLAQQMDAAARAAADALAQSLGLQPQLELSVTGLNWQMCAALLQLSDSPQAAQAAVKAALSFEGTVSPGTDVLPISICIQPLPYQEALQAASGSQSAFSSGQFLYAYLYTVYDESMTELDYVQPEPEGNLATGIVWPLAQHTRLRKTWFAARDDGARKHTGTDIWAPADTPIYSCTDGTVTFVGAGEGSGNTVIVTDAYGYEFHYYHMIRVSDFLTVGQQVAAGQLIGHVATRGTAIWIIYFVYPIPEVCYKSLSIFRGGRTFNLPAKICPTLGLFPSSGTRGLLVAVCGARGGGGWCAAGPHLGPRPAGRAGFPRCGQARSAPPPPPGPQTAPFP